MAISVVTAAVGEPVQIAEAKEHLRILHSDEDTLIGSYISAARQYVQTYLGRQLVTATLKYAAPTWPYTFDGVLQYIEIPYPPLQSIVSVEYTDVSGATQTWAASNYREDTSSVPGRLVLGYGKSWPAIREELDAVSITYVAGYGEAHDVPECVRTAIKMLAAHWFENREPVITGTIIAEVPRTIDALLAPERWGGYSVMKC